MIPLIKFSEFEQISREKKITDYSSHIHRQVHDRASSILLIFEIFLALYVYRWRDERRTGGKLLELLKKGRMKREKKVGKHWFRRKVKARVFSSGQTGSVKSRD